jgi:hypothetical protein
MYLSSEFIHTSSRDHSSEQSVDRVRVVSELDSMRTARGRIGRVAVRCLIMALAYLASAGAARPDLTITNAARVRAGITGIVHRHIDNSIGVDFSIVDPTGTNVTTFAIQRSTNLVAWADYTSTLVVTGSTSGEVSDFATLTKQFYRIRLINFN